ncbi:unnamed protein product [Adineta ricciae]|uniref:SGNH hydrolase-type esterase domain-containing protein n=1 Tax=Adineta ricciae TaxID=249248 RepID=A0A815LRX9_ADIRI|nr:unnamed protein product [Adineta ricciae]CAF1487210.1 unnamed protein product [Adineta ricciae]
MKPTSISKPRSSNQTMSHNNQKKPRKPKNKRRQQQRWRRKHNKPLLCEQPTYPSFPNQNWFSWRNENICQQIYKPIVVVAGSSMASRLNEYSLQTSKSLVKLTYESGCTCFKMLSWLRSIEGQEMMYGASRIILILGTNDLHVMRAGETVHRIRETVEAIRLLYPRVQVVWQLLQWRMKATRYLSDGIEVLKELDKCNIMLLELSRRLNFQTIDPRLTKDHIGKDNLHPTYEGSRIIEHSIRLFLERQ